MTQRVQEVMSANPVSVDASSPVAQAAAIMKERDIGDVLVRQDAELCGILTDRDVVVRGVANGLDLATTPVQEICSQEVVTVGPTATIEDAVTLMRERAVRRIAVVENDQPVGIVSIGDLAVIRDEDSVLADISNAPGNR